MGLRALLLLLPVALLLTAGCADFSRGKPLAASDADANASGPDAGSSSGTSYGTDVHVLLIDGCASCHSSEGAASNTQLVFTDSPSDYTATWDFVDVDAPEASRLVLKMEGRGHAGGAVYPRASPEHALVLRWIGEGAPP